MRKIIAFATILVLIATASLGLAAVKKGSQEGLTVSGKVVAIENGIVSLREPNGQIFKVAATSDKFKGIKIGDRVVIKDVKGWVVSINKIRKEGGKKLYQVNP